MAKTIQALIISMLLLGMCFFIILATKGSKVKDVKQRSLGRDNLQKIGKNLHFYQKANKGRPLKFPALDKSGLLAGSIKSTDPYFKTRYVYSGEQVGEYTIAAGQPIPPKELMTHKINLIVIKDAKEIAMKKSTRQKTIPVYCLRGDLSIGKQN